MYMYCFIQFRSRQQSLKITFFGRNSTFTCTFQTDTISKISGKMRPTWCFPTNHSEHKTSYTFIHRLKTRDFWSKRAQIESKNHDNVVNIVLYWTFLGVLAPYEVVERSCAFFYILMYFTRYKTNKCVSNFFDGTNFSNRSCRPLEGSWKTPL